MIFGKKILSLGCALIMLAFIGRTVRGHFEYTGCGARAEGLARAYTAEARGPEAMYYNPAGLSQEKRAMAMASYSRLYLGLSDNSNIGRGYLGYVHPYSDRLSMGLGWQNFMLAGYYSENTFYLSGGYEIMEGLRGGINIKVLHKNYGSTMYTDNSLNLDTGELKRDTNPVFNDGYSKTNVTFDMGGIYSINYNNRVALVLENITSPDMALYENDEDRVPFRMKAGYRYVVENLKLLGDVVYEKEEVSVRTGLENRFLDDRISLRGGIGLGSRQMRDLAVGASYLTEGNFRIDYGFTYPLVGIKDMYGTHKISLNMGFGDIKLSGVEYYNMGTEQFEREDYDRALELFSKALKSEPELSQARRMYHNTEQIINSRARVLERVRNEYEKGVKKIEENRFEEAYDIFDKILKTDDLGYKKIKDIQGKAKQNFKEIEGKESVVIREKLQNATDHHRDGNYEEAIEIYQEILKQNPTEREAIRGRATAREQLKIDQTAGKLKKKYERGLEKAGDKEWEEAVKILEEVAEADDLRSKKIQKINADAREELNRIKSSDEVLAKEYLNQATRAENRGAYRLAIENYRKALDKTPGEQRALIGLRRSRSRLIEELYSQGQEHYFDEEYDSAKEKFKEVLSIDSTHDRARRMLDIIKREK